MGEYKFDLQSAQLNNEHFRALREVARRRGAGECDHVGTFLSEARNPARPQFTDHCFTGDYPTHLTDVTEQEPGRRQLSLLAETA